LVQNGTDFVEQLQFLNFGLRRGHGENLKKKNFKQDWF
jgi:hypothetical protein